MRTHKESFTLNGSQQPIRALQFSPDERWIVSAGERGELKVWDLGM